MTNRTAKTLAPGIKASLSAFYNFNTTMPIVEMVKRARPVLRTRLNVSDDVEVIVRPLKKDSLRGRYFPKEKLIEISCRLSAAQALETYCHEMVHAEQYNEGRLSWTRAGSNWLQVWHGRPWKSPRNFNEYLALPWEVEAHARAPILAALVVESLK
jgi:hypothetical protein